MKTEKKELCEPTDNIGYCRASAASRCAGTDKHQRQSRVRNTPSKCPGKIPRLPGRRGHKDWVTAGRQLRPSCARSGTISPSLAVTQSVKGRNHNRLGLAIRPLRAFSKGHTRRGTVTTKGGQGGEQFVIETRQRQRRRKDVVRDDEEEERTGARDNPRRRSIKVGERHSSVDK